MPHNQQRLYCDNAATSFPKPPEVLEAMKQYAETLGASAGRGAYREAVETGELVLDCRRRIARLFGVEAPTHVIFTMNCSEALNLALKGLLRQGDHAVTTTMEHNSILRPLNALREQRGIEVTHIRADARTGRIDPDAVLAAARPNTRLIAVNHGSNVTGTVQPIEQIGPEARRRGIVFLVDAAQTAGHVPIDMRSLSIDLLAMPGHKGLMGPLGTGVLCIRPGLEERMSPLIEGGTGSISEAPVQPSHLPDKFESGSHNAIGLAGLRAAIQWIEAKSIEALAAHDRTLSAHFLERVSGLEGMTIYGPPQADQRVAVFGIRIEGFDPAELAAVLDTEFAIQARSGIQCAPLAHETIGTLTDGGTTRLSFGAFNTIEDVDRCAEALTSLATAGTSV